MRMLAVLFVLVTTGGCMTPPPLSWLARPLEEAYIRSEQEARQTSPETTKADP